MASNLSFGSSGRRSSSLSTGSPDPRQHPFGPGTEPGIRPVIRDDRRRGQPSSSRFPVAFRPPAFASWVILFPLGDSAFLTVGLPARATSGPDPVGVSTFRTHEIRPGWVPSLPRGGGVLPASAISPAGACRFSTASPCTPLKHSTAGAGDYEASSRVHSRSPVRPSPRPWPPDGTGALGLSPELRTPPLPATHVEAGTGPGHA